LFGIEKSTGKIFQGFWQSVAFTVVATAEAFSVGADGRSERKIMKKFDSF
jgi:hypothetical protein